MSEVFVWTTKNGQKLKLDEIENRHLINIKNMLEKAKKANKGWLSYLYSFDPNSMACILSEKDIEEAENRSGKIINCLKHINEEIKRRNKWEEIEKKNQ